jgi:hypothetical protein
VPIKDPRITLIPPLFRFFTTLGGARHRVLLLMRGTGRGKRIFGTRPGGRKSVDTPERSSKEQTVSHADEQVWAVFVDSTTAWERQEFYG